MKETALVFWFGLMALFMKDNLRRIWPMALVRLRIKMAIPTKGTGSTTKQMVLVFICTFQEQDMTVNGRKINSMAMGLKNGRTGTSTQETTFKAKKKDMVN